LRNPANPDAENKYQFQFNNLTNKTDGEFSTIYIQAKEAAIAKNNNNTGYY